ncbi:hypothetical protein [Wolbachia endosymbiont of Drosophila pseudotakahashii]|nr:hypothetical protein [Wolbachia endosymbiont of Drosophila pseudotakahashii]MCX3064711.1 hypothetical protein [Wolbachia endosymbiont of Drosophila pseudotakahashii]UZE38431.1 hypothetical protein ONI09_06115 [Wolbachia endosymbiont of Drosophila pseudotakahashii]
MLKHNVLDEITARLDSSVKHWNDIILFGIPVQLLASATCKLQCSYRYRC